MHRRHRAIGAVGLALALLACAPEPAPPEARSPAPPPRPVPPASAVDEDSARVARIFAAQEAQLLAQGFLRTDGGGADTPFTASMLVENFVRIALFDEYTQVGGRLVARPTRSRLRRWDDPVQMRVHFGDSVPAVRRNRDLAEVRSYAARLSRLTRHPVGLVDSGSAGANFHILVLSETERREIGPRLAELVPGIDPMSVRIVTDLPLSASCLVLAFATSGSSVYSRAVAVVRAELPDLTRQACYHEELAQGMGLPNDSSLARPSIFNDSLEFALLTGHDEILLRLLYDPRLRPGMTEAEARPVLQRIITEFAGGES